MYLILNLRIFWTDKKVIAQNNTLTLFSVGKDGSYKCDSQTSTTLDNSDKGLKTDLDTVLDITEAQVQAYIPPNSHSQKFSDGIYQYYY